MSAFFQKAGEGPARSRDATPRARRKRGRRDADADAGTYFEALEVLEAGARSRSYFGNASDIQEMQSQIDWLIGAEDRIRRSKDEHLARRASRRLEIAVVLARLALNCVATCTLVSFVAVLLVHIADSRVGIPPGPMLYVTGAAVTACSALQLLLKRLLGTAGATKDETSNPAELYTPPPGSDDG